MAIVIDTHALIWYLAGDARVSIRARKRIDQAIANNERIVIPLIVLMEVLALIRKKETFVLLGTISESNLCDCFSAYLPHWC